MIHIKEEPFDEYPINDDFDILDKILSSNYSDIDLNLDEEASPIKLNHTSFDNQNQFSVESFFKQNELCKSLKRKNTQPPIPAKAKQIPQQPQPDKIEQSELLSYEHEPLKPSDEELLLLKINSMDEELSKTSIDFQQSVARLRCKLNLRKLKRQKRLKIFDIDSMTNELIDSEKTSLQPTPCKETLMTIDSNNSTDIEVISINRILDRFNSSKKKDYFTHFQCTVGLVEFRNEDVKCLISPFSNQLLKPYIRRDYDELPMRLKLHKELVEKLNKEKFVKAPIDYVYLRPEHVFVINSLCKQFFWNGIDVSECLQYPDYTVVCLYKKLIIGFAFMVPNSSPNENYLSFIFVHADWRSSGIAKYMMYRLLSISSNQDVVLHVSVNSPAVLFYQKFGFKIEEYIEKFYDKYYSDEDHYYLSKNAFQMRLSK